MRIDDTRFSSSYLEGDAKDAALRARIARLEAEADLKPFTPPADLEQATTRPRAAGTRRSTTRGAATSQAGLAVLQRQAEQRGQELAEMEARVARLQDSYELVQQELAMMRPAAEKGVVSQRRPGTARAAGQRPEGRARGAHA